MVRRRHRSFHLALAASLILAPALASAWTPLPNAADPLVRMPGTQPSFMTVLQPSLGCFDCHYGVDPAVEQGFGWRGSNMAQAGRDPFFWAALTVAAQDSIYAIGRPNAADMCLRCHMPTGWLATRSDPPNGSLMSGYDFDGVSCDLCHRMVDPFFTDTHAGTREGADWMGNWDETNQSSTPSQAAADATLAADQQEAGKLRLFNGKPLYDATFHPAGGPGYDENGSGQYYVSTNAASRGPFADGSLPHDKLYSRYHKSKYFCETCHEVSNTVLANMAFASTVPNDGNTVLPSESTAPHGYVPIERTFSEFLLSDYGLPGGATGSGAFAGQTIKSCQDCHMPPSSGAGCNFPNAIDRPAGSVEHPNSGPPVHDMTGGNALLPWLLASTVPASTNYDATNAALLGQGHAALTMVLDEGLPLDPLALLAAHNRTVASLGRAASIEGLAYDPASGAASFRIRNHTGHKLLTGYTEGRRMFVNVKLFAGAALIAEVNPYDSTAGTLRGLPKAYAPASPPLGPGEIYRDDLVIEAHPSSSVTGETASFHFVLADGMGKDNRLPPRGFRIAEAAARGAEPAASGAAAPGMFTAAEYAGGYRDVTLSLPPGGDRVEVEMGYQTASREYVEFLRDEIKGTGTTLKSPTPSGEAKAYVAQTDAFFGGLKAWGDTLWQLWQHNQNAPGAAPIRMTRAALALDTCAGKPDGAACDDGNRCTSNDACMAGACHGGPPVLCDDGNDCTDDACDPQAGCVFTFNTAPCEDGDLCTAPDTCAFGVCVPGALMDCKDKEYCTIDSCDPAAGCVHAPNPDPACAVDAGTSSSSSSASSSSSSASSSSSSGAGGQPGTGGAGGSTASSSSSASSGGGGDGGGGESGGCGCAEVGGVAGGGEGGAPIALVLAISACARRRRARGERRR